MGLLDKMKSATGLGLNPEEAYNRAYEKGVLLGKYDAASEMFAKAAEKYEEASSSELATRARANQFLYQLVSTKDLSHIDKLLPHLQNLQEIEELGSQSERMPVNELIAELEARKFEAAAFGSSGNMLHAQALHAKAADRFQGILKTKLKTYALVPAKDHNDSAEERFFLHQGYNFFYQGLLAQDADPIQAAEKLTQGALAFKRAKDDGLRGMADGLVANLRVKRTCWFCHREMQGLGLNTDYYPAKTTQYGRDLVVRLGQDATAIEPSGNAVAVCLPCASMIQAQADAYATAEVESLRKELVPQFDAIIEGLHALSERIGSLERVAHRH